MSELFDLGLFKVAVTSLSFLLFEFKDLLDQIPVLLEKAVLLVGTLFASSLVVSLFVGFLIISLLLVGLLVIGLLVIGLVLVGLVLIRRGRLGTTGINACFSEFLLGLLVFS